jgi:hypothetical protein
MPLKHDDSRAAADQLEAVERQGRDFGSLLWRRIRGLGAWELFLLLDRKSFLGHDLSL